MPTRAGPVARLRRLALSGLALAACAVGPRPAAAPPPPAVPEVAEAPSAPAVARPHPASGQAPRASARPTISTAERLVLLRNNCGRGGAGACIEIGRLHERGADGLAHDPAEAARAYGVACRMGDAEGCQRLDGLYQAEDTTPPDHAPVRADLRAGCQAGQPEGCVGLATLIGLGLGDAAAPERAATLLLQACDAGSGAGCDRLAALRREGIGVRQDDEEAEKLELRACNLGREAACVALGIRILQVTGGQMGREWWSVLASATSRALDYFRGACRKGFTAGCVEYAQACFEGLGVPVDVTQGRALLTSACGDGDGRACLLLARLEGTPAGAPGGGPDARRLLEKGCQARHGPACAALGEALEAGRAQGGASDPAERALARARGAYELGCTLRAPEACRAFQRALAEGRGGARDPAGAARAGALACRWGGGPGCEDGRLARLLQGR